MRFKAALPLLICALFGAISLGVADAAVADTAYAPHARAAALVNRDASIVKSTGVEAVTKASTGIYCIRLDPRINATEAVPVATLENGANWGSEIFIYRDSSACGTPARHVRVLTGLNGAASDQPFYVVVP